MAHCTTGNRNTLNYMFAQYHYYIVYHSTISRLSSIETTESSKSPPYPDPSQPNPIATMPTPIDRALNSRVRPPGLLSNSNTQAKISQNFFFGFAGIVTAAAAWSIWGQDMFPQLQDPKGDPQKWTDEEMRVWLNNVCLHCFVICFYAIITDDWS